MGDAQNAGMFVLVCYLKIAKDTPILVCCFWWPLALMRTLGQIHIGCDARGTSVKDRVLCMRYWRSDKYLAERKLRAGLICSQATRHFRHEDCLFQRTRDVSAVWRVESIDMSQGAHE